MKLGTRLIVVLGSLLAGADLAACGDKFLVVGRGTRFQKGPEAVRPYSVLLYAPQSSPLAESRQKASVEKALLRAGYRPATAVTSGELAEMVRTSPPDVVVASTGDSRDVEHHVSGGPGRLVLVPASSISADSLLDAVDEAVSKFVKSR
jgi:hypothetical protein